VRYGIASGRHVFSLGRYVVELFLYFNYLIVISRSKAMSRLEGKPWLDVREEFCSLVPVLIPLGKRLWYSKWGEGVGGLLGIVLDIPIRAKCTGARDECMAERSG
jgi:hypothetical protein